MVGGVELSTNPGFGLIAAPPHHASLLKLSYELRTHRPNPSKQLYVHTDWLINLIHEARS